MGPLEVQLRKVRSKYGVFYKGVSTVCFIWGDIHTSQLTT